MNRIKPILKSIGKLITIIAVVGLFLLSIKVTKPDLLKLVSSAPRAKSIIGQMLSADLTDRESEMITVSQVVPVPCGSVSNPEALVTGPQDCC